MGNADNLQFADNSFDVIITDAVLIYVNPDKIKKVKSEFLRVAKKGIIMAEFQIDDWDGDGHISLLHWTRDYRKLFKENKVEIQRLDNWDNFKWDTLGVIATIKL